VWGDFIFGENIFNTLGPNFLTVGHTACSPTAAMELSSLIVYQIHVMSDGYFEYKLDGAHKYAYSRLVLIEYNEYGYNRFKFGSSTLRKRTAVCPF
jgi:hypothetical protein